MRALYRYGSDLPVRPKCPPPFYKIIFPRTTDLYSTYKHDNHTRGGFGLVCATGMYLPLGQWFFPYFKQEFLLNGKRVKCLRRNFGSARRLTLPLQKGDWTRWVTLLVACSRLSDSGRSESKRKAKNCSFLPFYFRVRAFSIQRALLSRSVEQATLLAEPTFCNLNGSPCFVKKCVKRCLFQESSGRRVTLLLETNFLHISGA